MNLSLFVIWDSSARADSSWFLFAKWKSLCAPSHQSCFGLRMFKTKVSRESIRGLYRCSKRKPFKETSESQVLVISLLCCELNIHVHLIITVVSKAKCRKDLWIQQVGFKHPWGFRNWKCGMRLAAVIELRSSSVHSRCRHVPPSPFTKIAYPTPLQELYFSILWSWPGVLIQLFISIAHLTRWHGLLDSKILISDC